LRVESSVTGISRRRLMVASIITALACGAATRALLSPLTRSTYGT
jgi:hypothetical protein